MDAFKTTYQRLVQAGAIAALLVAAPVATPWTLAALLPLAPGAMGVPLTPLSLLLINMWASVVVVWAVFRLARPEPVLGLVDGYARGLIALWVFYYVSIGVVPLWISGVCGWEGCWALAQFGGYWRLYRI